MHGAVEPTDDAESAEVADPAGVAGPVDVRQPVDVLRRLGGAASMAELTHWTTRHYVRRDVRSGAVRHAGRGMYVLPDLPSARVAATTAHGVISHASAALEWDIKVVLAPAQVHITVPRGAHPALADNVTLHWSSLSASDLAEGVTSPLRTVLDCAATMPFVEALAVADSAIHSRLVIAGQLVDAAETCRGPGRQRRLRVARAADGRAENPFESALRAIVIVAGVGGFEPQVDIRTPKFAARVDLADRRRRIVLEADSYAHHGSRRDLARDCRRYDELVRDGWTVLRFAWEHVMFEPRWVATLVRDVCTRHDRAVQQHNTPRSSP